MNEEERPCELCDEFFTPKKRKQKYCSKECALEALHKPTWADRLHDGMRLLSDDFGELDGDKSVPFRN